MVGNAAAEVTSIDIDECRRGGNHSVLQAEATACQPGAVVVECLAGRRQGSLQATWSCMRTSADGTCQESNAI